MIGAVRDVVVLGEALVDIVRTPAGTAESPGGGPANVAVALGRLGRSVSLATRLGDDSRGRAIRAWLAASGVEVDVVEDAPRTSVADALIGPDGDASYTFDIDWSLPEPIRFPVSRVVHTGSIATCLPPGADSALAAMEDAAPRALVTFDPNVRPAIAGSRGDARRRIERAVATSSVVKASEDDLAWLYPASTSERTARVWRGMGPSLVVVTEGAGGAFAVHASGIVRVPATPVRVVDTVGAGDTFMGFLIDGILDAADRRSRDPAEVVASLGERDIASILGRAAEAAAVTASRVGMDPPRRGELPSRMTTDEESA